jgi:hypothetical protein
MATVVPIYNADEQQQHPISNYAYPPHYTAVTSISEDKPPSYEQTIEHISETNNTSHDGPAILPVTTMTAASTQMGDTIRSQY